MVFCDVEAQENRENMPLTSPCRDTSVATHMVKWALVNGCYEGQHTKHVILEQAADPVFLRDQRKRVVRIKTTASFRASEMLRNPLFSLFFIADW